MSDPVDEAEENLRQTLLLQCACDGCGRIIPPPDAPVGSLMAVLAALYVARSVYPPTRLLCRECGDDEPKS